MFTKSQIWKKQQRGLAYSKNNISFKEFSIVGNGEPEGTLQWGRGRGWRWAAWSSCRCSSPLRQPCLPLLLEQQLHLAASRNGLQPEKIIESLLIWLPAEQVNIDYRVFVNWTNATRGGVGGWSNIYIRSLTSSFDCSLYFAWRQQHLKGSKVVSREWTISSNTVARALYC